MVLLSWAGLAALSACLNPTTLTKSRDPHLVNILGSIRPDLNLVRIS